MVARNAEPHPANASQRFEAYVGQVSWLVQLVALDRNLGLKIPQVPRQSYLMDLATVEKGACSSRAMRLRCSR